MASRNSLTMSLPKLSYRSSVSLQTQRQVASSLFQSFPTKALKISTTPQLFTTRRSFKHSTITAWNLNDQQQNQDSSKPAKVHELRVYEFNEGGRDTPAYLKLIQESVKNSLGDLVPFSNTLYSGNLEKKLGITAGLCVFIRPEKDGYRYEAIYSFYFKNLGHISVQGTYLKCQDKNHHDELAVTGGSGKFKGVSGKVILQQLEFASKMFYTFYLEGIPDLPSDLQWRHVKPSSDVEPSETARHQQLD